MKILREFCAGTGIVLAVNMPAAAVTLPSSIISLPLHRAGSGQGTPSMGWAHPVIDPISQQLLELCKHKNDLIVLEIGGDAHTSLEAMKAGASVWVNDADPHSLEEFLDAVPPEFGDQVQLAPGDFPEEPTLPDDYFDAVRVVHEFHYFPPKKLRTAIQRIHQVLKKGGRVFVITDTPYLATWQKAIPIYEERKDAGEEFPGYYEDVATYMENVSPFLPNQIHFLDPEVLRREFEAAGFEIEYVDFMERDDYPDYIRLDGRESVGLIARKP